jgi:hypothetical protein
MICLAFKGAGLAGEESKIQPVQDRSLRANNARNAQVFCKISANFFLGGEPIFSVWGTYLALVPPFC